MILHELKIEHLNSKGYSVRNLKYMKKFYLEYKDNEFAQQLVTQVPWGNNIVLMEEYDNPTVAKFVTVQKESDIGGTL